ncbi:hypothetical protein HY995_00870 [Candidatus Micrarchaeota archaeon]|nr:hypothetical protein [Candidatus Micrarchaeota archaeon]
MERPIAETAEEIIGAGEKVASVFARHWGLGHHNPHAALVAGLLGHGVDHDTIGHAIDAGARSHDLVYASLLLHHRPATQAGTLQHALRAGAHMERIEPAVYAIEDGASRKAARAALKIKPELRDENLRHAILCVQRQGAASDIILSAIANGFGAEAMGPAIAAHELLGKTAKREKFRIIQQASRIAKDQGLPEEQLPNVALALQESFLPHIPRREQKLSDRVTHVKNAIIAGAEGKLIPAVSSSLAKADSYSSRQAESLVKLLGDYNDANRKNYPHPDSAFQAIRTIRDPDIVARLMARQTPPGCLRDYARIMEKNGGADSRLTPQQIDRVLELEKAHEVKPDELKHLIDAVVENGRAQNAAFDTGVAACRSVKAMERLEHAVATTSLFGLEKHKELVQTALQSSRSTSGPIPPATVLTIIATRGTPNKVQEQKDFSALNLATQTSKDRAVPWAYLLNLELGEDLGRKAAELLNGFGPQDMPYVAAAVRGVAEDASGNEQKPPETSVVRRRGTKGREPKDRQTATWFKAAIANRHTLLDLKISGKNLMWLLLLSKSLKPDQIRKLWKLRNASPTLGEDFFYESVAIGTYNTDYGTDDENIGRAFQADARGIEFLRIMARLKSDDPDGRKFMNAVSSRTSNEKALDDFDERETAVNDAKRIVSHFDGLVTEFQDGFGKRIDSVFGAYSKVLASEKASGG